MASALESLGGAPKKDNKADTILKLSEALHYLPENERKVALGGAISDQIQQMLQSLDD